VSCAKKGFLREYRLCSPDALFEVSGSAIILLLAADFMPLRKLLEILK